MTDKGRTAPARGVGAESTIGAHSPGAMQLFMLVPNMHGIYL